MGIDSFAIDLLMSSSFLVQSQLNFTKNLDFKIRLLKAWEGMTTLSSPEI